MEKDFYECVYKQTRSSFDRFVDKGTLLHNYAHVFELLSRLRQAVDHPCVPHAWFTFLPSFDTQVVLASLTLVDLYGVCMGGSVCVAMQVPGCAWQVQRQGSAS